MKTSIRTLLLWSLLICFQPVISSAQVLKNAEQKALHHQKKGKKALARNKLAIAEKHLEKSLQLAPANAAMKQLLAEVYIRRGRVVKAVAYLERFYVDVRDTLRGPETCYHLGLMLVNYATSQQKDSDFALDHALPLFEKALTLNEKRRSPDFDLQAECFAAIGLTRVLNTSIAKNPALSKHEALHKTVSPHVLKKAEWAFNEALRYKQDHLVAAANLNRVRHGLSLLNIAAQELDQTPYIAAPGLDSTATVPDSIEHNIADRQLADSIKILIPLYQAVVDTLNAYDEVVLVLDISGSMEAPMFPSQSQTRLEFMKNLAFTIVGKVNPKVKIGAVTVGGSCNNSPYLEFPIRPGGSKKHHAGSRSELAAQILQLQTMGATPLHRVLWDTPKFFADRLPQSDNKRRCICLLSDGLNSCNDNSYICDIAQYLFTLGIKTHVVSFLLEDSRANELEYEAYRCVAELSGGVLFSNNKDGQFDTQIMEKRLKPFAIELPEFMLDECTALKNLVRVSWGDVRKNARAAQKNTDLIGEVRVIATK